jgi:putative oxidoreductase
MIVVRRIARPMLASMFVVGGLDSFRNPKPKVPVADDVAQPVADAIPVDLPDDTEQLVKINGAVQVAAGVLLALGRFPRLSAVVLAGTLVPTTAAGHRFWEAEDEENRSMQMVHFLKNVSMFGGLLIAAVDTEGKPSVAWRARRASQRGSDKADKAIAKAEARAERSRRVAEEALAKAAAKPAKGAGKAAKSARKATKK